MLSRTGPIVVAAVLASAAVHSGKCSAQEVHSHEPPAYLGQTNKLQSPLPPGCIIGLQEYHGGPSPEEKAAMLSSDKYWKQANADISNGQWAKAEAEYGTALDVWPGHTICYYGLDQCAAHRGDLKAAISFYKRNIYSPDPKHVFGTTPGDGWSENNDRRLMEYVLLLSRAGDVDEAVLVYNRAVKIFNDFHQDRGDWISLPFI